MKTTWRLWVYRHILAVALLLSHAIAAIVLLALLAVWPKSVHYLLDLVSPVTELVRDLLWQMFPEAEWVRKAGKWMGAVVRKGLSYTEARHEAIARLLLLDGMLLLTLMAWAINKLLGLWVTLKVAAWFDRHNVILKRAVYEALIEEVRVLREEARVVKLPPAPQLGPSKQAVR